ncbi:MAG: hypothetical protein ACYCXU_07125 [Thermoleophilia bacterium]
MPTSKNQKRVKRALRTGGYVLALALALLAASGCGSDSGSQPAASTATVAAGAALSSQPSLSASDLSLDAGQTSVFLANASGVPAKVNFTLEGPWDLSDGPADAALTISMVSKNSAPGSEHFPDATVAARLSWNPARGPDEFNFETLGNDAWQSFGKSGGQGLVLYSLPADALEFPATVGSNWSSVYSRTGTGASVGVIESSKIVGYGKLTVPAGTFDAFLLQTRVAVDSGAPASTVTWDYIWFVPGVGRAAEIISQGDEQNPLFTSAYAVYRLKSY